MAIKAATVQTVGLSGCLTSVPEVAAHIDGIDNRLTQLKWALRRSLEKLPERAAAFLVSYKHPPEKINRHLEMLHELYDTTQALETVYTLLLSKFNPSAKTANLAARIEKMITSTRRHVDRSMKALSDCVKRHSPEYFKVCVNKLHTLIQTHSSTFKSVNPMFMLRVITSEGQTIGTQFSVYFCFNDIKDNTGYVHNRFHVVVSCVVNMYGQYNMNYCLQPTLIMPGKFKAKDEFSSPEECFKAYVNA